MKSLKIIIILFFAFLLSSFFQRNSNGEKVSITNNANVISFIEDDTIPENINAYPNLKGIGFENYKGKYLPKNISLIKNLKGVYIRGCIKFSLFELFELFSNIESFESLTIMDIKLDSIPSNIIKLENLKYFTLENVAINNIFLDSLFKLRKLEEILIRNSKFDSKPDWLIELPNLKLLVLDGTNLEYFPNSLIKLKNLTGINLGSNPKLNIPLIIKSLPKRDSMYGIMIGNNNLKKIPKELLKYKKISRLDLSKNRINEIDKCISSIEILELNLKKNSIKNIDALCKMKYLNTLYLDSNQIKTFPSSIGLLKDNLKWLYLVGNPLDSNERKRIQKELPKTNITFDYVKPLW